MRNDTPKRRECVLPLALTLLLGAGCATNEPTPTSSSCASIRRADSVLTMINLLRPSDADQDRVVDLLNEGLDEEIRGLDGFISATVHRSLDNAYVVNYAQWADAESLEGVSALFEAGLAPKMAEAFSLANPDFHPHVIVGQQSDGPVSMDCSGSGLTLINFLVPQAGVDADAVADQLVLAMERDVAPTPGFVSATVHQSQDSELVVNYAQWEDEASLGGLVTQLEAGNAPDLGAAFSMASPDFHPYLVEGTHFAEAR